MSGLSDFFKQNANVLGNTILGQISDAAGGPSLPPLQFVDPNQNQNNYVEPRVIPNNFQPETTPPPYNDYIKWGILAVGAIFVIGLIAKRS